MATGVWGLVWLGGSLGTVLAGFSSARDSFGGLIVRRVTEPESSLLTLFCKLWPRRELDQI